MKLSIIILNYKQQGLVKQCLKGIVTAQPQLDYEIIVVDNNSEDDTLAMVVSLFEPKDETKSQLALPIVDKLKIPPIKAIQSGINGGFAAGNNLGIAQAAGEYIMILNPDIAILPESLERMVEFMDAHKDVGMIGPRLINPDGTVQYSCRRFPNFITPLLRRTFFGKLPTGKKSVEWYLMKDFDHLSNRQVDWLFGACLLVRKTLINSIGKFDERFFMYFEDLDLCRRIWQVGSKVVYFSEVELVHYHQRLSAERSGVLGIFTKGGRVHLISGVKYFLKYFGIKLPPTNAGQI
ncbi:MAG: glycosyltransferase family 2 protein [Patescibacteria group bacterium]|jgi:GT2 family glycosyltransferase|nr:glycosyltransferase family 2 protein [Patescibacteria group bacterium]